MKLALVASPKKVLEMTLPDGKEINLVLRKRTVREAAEGEHTIKKLSKLRDDGEMGSIEFIFKSLEIVLEKFDREPLMDLELDHMTEISKAIGNLQLGDEEKKSQESASSQSSGSPQKGSASPK